jgi:WD40 repeat protein
LIALIALGTIGVIALQCDEPRPQPFRMRLVSGAAGRQTLAIALSPDGQRVATTSNDGRASLLDLEKDAGIGRILDPNCGAAWGLAFSPDGRSLALGRSSTCILLFDLARGGPGVPLGMPLTGVGALAYSPDGRTLAAASARDGKIVLWDLGAGRVRTSLHGHSPTLCLAFALDGRSLAAGERDEKRVTLWDLKTGLDRSILKEASGPVSSVSFSTDGSLLAAASPLDRAVRLWDPRSGELRLQLAGHDGGTVAVAFSPDGLRLATSGNDGMVRLWSPTTGAPLAALDGRSSWLSRIAFSADGRTLAAAGSDNDIRVWNMDDIAEASGDPPGP